jgi:lauroyl/myristoyl acyltransferase
MRDVGRVRNYLALLFPDHQAETELIVRQQLALTIWNFITLNLIPNLTHEQSAQLLPVEGMENLAALRDQGKSALLLGAHVGPYAYPIAAVMQANGFQVHEVGHARPRQGSSWLYRKLYWPRIQKTCRYMQVIDPLKGGQAELLDVLRQGKVLFLLPDQLYIVEPDTPRSRHLVPIDYLGHSVNLETGGLRLCKRLGTAVFTALPTFINNQYHIKIEPFTLPTDGLSPDDLAVDLQHFMNRVAECIQAQPFLWRDLRRADLLARLGAAIP